MRSFIFSVLAFSAALISAPFSISAEEPKSLDEVYQNAISLQGFTGLLNIPNAEITNDGEISGIYSNQEEYKYRSQLKREDNYLFSIGILPFAEIGGRLTDAPGVMRDLSGSLKVKLHPNLAVGIQDVGGGASFFGTQYAVASEAWWRFRMSLGYGLGPDRMDGVFGGIELKATDWLSIIGENDTDEYNVGARIVSPEFFGWPVNAQAIAKTSLSNNSGNSGNNVEFGIGLQFPLGRHYEDQPPAQSDIYSILFSSEHASNHRSSNEDSAGILKEQEVDLAPIDLNLKASDEISNNSNDAADSLQLLSDKLISNGFQNVSIGTKGNDVLVVKYENNIYNYNEMDGLGVVLGIAIDAAPKSFKSLHVIIMKENLDILQISAPIKAFREFLQGSGDDKNLNKKLVITKNCDSDISLVTSRGNSSQLTSSLVLYPGLKTFLGTEVGILDYLLSVKADYFVHTWDGSMLNARWDIPVSWSENFNDGKDYESSREHSQLERLILSQAITARPDIMFSLGAGMVQPDTYGTLNEAMWTPGDGTHRVSFKQAYASNRDKAALVKDHEMYLGSYRYYFSPFDLSLKVTAGQFFENDKGFNLNMTRFFGDTALSVYFQNSWAAISNDQERVVGMQISIPLTLRKDMKPGLLQVRGSEEWTYSQETRLVSGDEANYVSTSVGNNLTVPSNLERTFFNRDRLSEPYIRQHLKRLRDAYIIYR